MNRISVLLATISLPALAGAQTTSSTIPTDFDTKRGNAAVFAGLPFEYRSIIAPIFWVFALVVRYVKRFGLN